MLEGITDVRDTVSEGEAEGEGSNEEERPNECRFCGQKGYVGVHMGGSEECRKSYALFLGLKENADIPSIMEKRRKEKKKAQKSRTNESRKRERTKSNEKNSDGLKLYFSETSIPKWIYRCFVCDRVGSRRMMESLLRSEARFAVSPCYLRDSLLWKCKNCKGEQMKDYENPDPWLNMTTVLEDDREIVVPSTTGVATPIGNATHLLLPSSFSALDRVKNLIEPKLSPEIIHKVQSYPGEVDFNSFAAYAFEHQMKKILQCKISSGIYNGEIVDSRKKSITLSEPFLTTSRVKGTDDYYDQVEKDLKFTIFQEGSVFLKVTAHLPKQTDCSLATGLMQLNENHIEPKTIVNKDGTEKTEFKVHPHASLSGICPEDCLLVLDVKEHAANKGITPKMVSYGSFLTSTATYIRSMKTQLSTLAVKTLGATRYYSGMQFPNDDPDSTLVVAAWPEALKTVNEKIAGKEHLTTEDIEAMTEFIDKNIIATINPAHLESLLKSEVRVKEVIKLAKLFQYDVNGKQHVLSNLTMKRERPSPPEGERWSPVDLMTMTDTLEDIKNTFCERIEEIEDMHFSFDSTSTLNDVLDEFSQQEGFSLLKNGRYFHLKFPGKPIYKLLPDGILLDLIKKKELSDLSAIYHRSISMTTEAKLEIVLKRPDLRDRAINQFNPILLFASKAKNEVELFVAEKSSNVRDFVRGSNKMPDQLEELRLDFVEVSNEKAFWILDPKKHLFERDSKPLYVGIKYDRSLKFKVAKISNQPSNFTSIVDGKEYELVRNLYDMYLDRFGFAKLTYKQLLHRYDKEAKERGNEEEQEVDVEDEEENVLITCRDDEEASEGQLPKVIMTLKGEKLVRRKRGRVILHKAPPLGSEDYMFMNVVLYHPHSSEKEVKLEPEGIEELFGKKDENPMMDGEGKTLTKLETVRAKMHPALNQELWRIVSN